MSRRTLTREGLSVRPEGAVCVLDPHAPHGAIRDRRNFVLGHMAKHTRTRLCRPKRRLITPQALFT